MPERHPVRETGEFPREAASRSDFSAACQSVFIKITGQDARLPHRLEACATSRMRLASRQSMRIVSILLALLSIVPAAIAQPGLNSLPEVEFSQLSQRDPNPLGEKALSINPTQWKHGETEHFIYHFAHTYVATPISVEAEFHYRVVAKELECDQPLTDIKSNVYIFERPEDWQQFQGLGELEKWTGGIHSQGSLFILRNPEQKFSGNVLGHEIVHLVLHRFYADGIPCWLNEGIAQYISKSAHASYQRARGYVSKPHSEAIASEEVIPRSEEHTSELQSHS